MPLTNGEEGLYNQAMISLAADDALVKRYLDVVEIKADGGTITELQEKKNKVGTWQVKEDYGLDDIGFATAVDICRQRREANTSQGLSNG